MTTTWTNESKAGGEGQGWLAGQVGVTAGMTIEPISGLVVYAGLLGTGQTWTNLTKI